MLERIRKHTHGWLAWGFLICIAVVFIFWGTVGLRLEKGKYIDVNGKKLYANQVESFKQIFPNADLVQLTASMQALEKAGFSLSKEQLDNIIKTMPYFQIDGKFSSEAFARLLRHNPQQLEIIEKGAYYNSLSEQMAYGLQHAQADFPSLTSRYFKLMDQKRTMSSLTIDSNSFVNQVNVDNKEIAQYYQANKANLIDLAKVKLEYIKLSFTDIVKTIKLTDADIEEYYNNNAGQFVIPGKKRISQIIINNSKDSKAKLEDVLKQLEQNKEAFGDLAASSSDDVLTAKQKGDIGWYQDGDMGDKVLDDAIANLNKIGDVSQVVSKDNKSYIFKLTQNEAKSKLSLAQAREDIISKLNNEKAGVIYADLKEQLERKSFESADSLDTVAQDLELKSEKTDWINKESKPIKSVQSFEQELIGNQKLMAAAFSEDVLENRNNSSVIDINPETAVVIRVAEFKPQRVKELSEVSKEITDTIKLIKAKQEAKKLAQKIWADFAANANKSANKSSADYLEQLSKNYPQAKYSKPTEVSYLDTFWDKNDNATASSKEELKQAFELPKPSQQHPVSAKLIELSNGNQAIVAVNNVALGKFDETNNEQKQQSANQLKYFMLMRDNVNFFNRVNKETVIKSYM